MRVITGPKMYIAFLDKGSYGSTKLHLDVADAWNILLQAGNNGDDEVAIWLIFCRQDADTIAKFFRDQNIFVHPGHPVHAQQIFVTADMLTLLEEKTGVRPYVVRQRQGDTVFVPALSAHQVRFLLRIQRL